MASSKNTFISPDGSKGTPEFEVGTNLLISWETVVDVYNISIWQQFVGDHAAQSYVNVFSPAYGIPNSLSSFNWTVQLYNYNTSISNMFFFWINYGAPATNWTSTYFNITDRTFSVSATAGASTSSATSSSSSTSLPTLSSSSSSLHLSSSTSSSSSPSNTLSQLSESSGNSGVLTTDAKVGIGAGIGLGIPLLASSGAVAFMMYRRRRNYASMPPFQLDNVPYRPSLPPQLPLPLPPLTREQEELEKEQWGQAGLVIEGEIQIPELPTSRRGELSGS